MKYPVAFLILAAVPIALGAALSAQTGSEQQAALREAKTRANAAEERSERLRQEAANASGAADRLLAQRAVLSAEIDAANAQIQAARARIAIINRRQSRQQAELGRETEPLLRLNAALFQLTNRPATFLLAQPGSRRDYVHLRAVLDSVQPEIDRRTAVLKQQISVQKELRRQEEIATESLRQAGQQLQNRQKSLAQLERSNRNRAGALSASAAAEFERAIAQGERARDIVEEIDTARLSGERAADLAALDGPVLRRKDSGPRQNSGAYRLPDDADLVLGFSEINQTGYRERGVKIALPAESDVVAPAGGRVAFAGIYRSYGQIVIIEHDGGWTTLVTNLGSLAVDEGEQVGQGDVIGQTGSEESEISFELRRKGRVIDIAAMLL